MRPAARPFGDAAFLVSLPGLDAARAFGRAVEDAVIGGTGPAAVTDIVVGFDSVVVRCQPGAADDGVARWLESLAADTPDRPEGARDGTGGPTIEIPVAFDGPDLDTVADALGEPASAVIELLTGTALEVALLGFAPGFPYLVGLPGALAAVGRRSTPRLSVPAGSVAVGGGFASVYPQSSPGGWMILGHTSTRLFDPHRAPFALLRPGNTVRFAATRAGAGNPGRPEAAGASSPRPPLAAAGPRVVEVVEPGLLSLVQDGGRRGMAALGVPAAGPADAESMQLANALVGNPADAACIEVTARGPTLRFAHRSHAAVVGSVPDGVDVDLDGHPAGPDRVLPVEPGQTLTVGRVRTGLRAYLAISGGLLTEPLVGSRSSDQLSGLGPGPLRAGDRLDLGASTRPHGVLDRHRQGPLLPSDPLRVVLGPHPLPASAGRILVEDPWTVGADSNRIGLRLHGGRPLDPGRSGVTSTGMVAGAIQVPPDGAPIVLMVDHATMGGYPVVACVISADLPRLGQVRPGERVSFVVVEPTEARLAFRRRARALSGSVSGWFPTATAT